MERLLYLRERYFNNTATPAEREELYQLLKDIDPETSEFFKPLDDELNTDVQPTATEQQRLAIIFGKLEQRILADAGKVVEFTKEKQTSRILRIAASVAFILFASYGSYRYYHYTQQQRYALTEMRAGDEIRKLMLSDGSIVWLKAHASLTYAKEFPATGERVVTVTGEALFEVAKDKDRPFVVNSRDMVTRVVGTSFNLKEGTADSEIFVLTGKVSVTAKSTSEQIDLTPSEKAIYAHNVQRLTKLETAPSEKVEAVQAYTAGTEYDLNFSDTPMSDVVTRMEKKFNVRIRVSSAINNCVITANLSDQSLSSALDRISDVLLIKYDRTGDEVTLTGNGCPQPVK